MPNTQPLLRIIVIFLVLCFGNVHSVAASQANKVNTIHWLEYDTALQQAKETHKLIFIYAYADWCRYCQKTSNTTFKDPRLIRILNGSYLPVSINVDKQMPLAKQFKIHALPTIIITDTSNEELKRFNGYIDRQVLISEARLLIDMPAYTPEASHTENKAAIIKVAGNTETAKGKQFLEQALALEANNAKVTITHTPEGDSGHPSAKVCTTSGSQCSLEVTDFREMPSAVNQILNVGDKIEAGKIEYLNQTLSPALISFVDHPFIFVSTYWLIGLVLAFTPCILPLLLLIFGLINGRSEQTSYTSSLMLTITYIFSLALTYACIGLLSGFFGIYLNAYFQQPIVIFLFCLIITIFALSLIGIIHFRLPFSVTHFTSHINRIRESYTYTQVILMGMVATIIIAPCMAAPLFTVIGVMASAQQVTSAFLALFLIGLGIGSPLLLLVIVGQKLFSASNEGMMLLRVFLGITLLGIVISILSPIISTTTYMILWSMLCLFTAIYLYQYSKASSLLISLKVLLSCIATLFFFYGALLFIAPFIGSVSPFNPLNTPEITYKANTFNQIADETDFNASVLLQEDMPALVFFSADWCKSCQQFKSQILQDSHIQQHLNGFRLFEVDLTTANSPQYAIAKQYKIVGPPEIIFFYSDGTLSKYRVGGMTSISNFDHILHSILTKNSVHKK